MPGVPLEAVTLSEAVPPVQTIVPTGWEVMEMPEVMDRIMSSYAELQGAFPLPVRVRVTV